MNNLFEILELNGLTLQMLNELSYKSQLGISLKRDLRYFDISLLKDELQKGLIRDEECFKENLEDVLRNC